MTEIILRPDSTGRVNIGDFAQGVSSYRVTIGECGTLTFYPYAEVPFSEKWIFEDKKLLEKFKREYKDYDGKASLSETITDLKPNL